MLINQKHIVSILLAMILFIPAVVKLEHHHEYDCNHKNEKGSATFFSEKCLVCDLQFLTFIVKDSVKNTIRFVHIDVIACSYISAFYPNHSAYLFLLRAPPVLHLV